MDKPNGGDPLIRTFIFVVAILAIALTSSPLAAQAKPTAVPKTERALQEALRRGAYVGRGFKVTKYEKGRYLVVSADTKAAQKEVKSFLETLGITKKTTWQTDEMYGERPMVEPINFLKKLPYETKRFRIEFDGYSNKVVIVPSVEINQGRYATRTPQEELKAVWPTYSGCVNEAFGWLRKQGYSTNFFGLEIWMEDFWPDGKSLKYQNPR